MATDSTGSRKRNLILGEAEQWVREGIIDESVRRRLEERYAAADNAATTSWRSIVFLSVGALFVGLGVIALLAANWDALSRPTRAVIAFTPLTFCAGAWLVGTAKGWRSRTFLEPLGVFWTLAIGAGIALIAQTYQISGNGDSFVLSWTLLTLPVLYGTRAVTPAIGYFIGLFAWVCIRADLKMNSQVYWLLAPLAIPALALIRAEAPRGARLMVITWCAALISTAALGFTLGKVLPGLCIIIYSGTFASLLTGGLLVEPRGDSIWQTPMRTLGAAGQAGLLYLLMFRGPWKEIGWRHWCYDRIDASWQTVFDYVMVVAMPVLAVGLTGLLLCRALRASRVPEADGRGMLSFIVPSAFVGFAPVFLAGMYTFSASEQHMGKTAGLITAAYLVLLALATLGAGLVRRSLLLLNGGVLILLAVIIARFFMDDYSFTARGVAFVICGLFFFVTNWVASRKLRENA